MSAQRRVSTSNTGGTTPGRDDEYPTDTFDSVAGSDTEQEDERPTQVFSAIRDEPAEQSPVAEQLFGGSGVPEDDDTAVFPRYRDTDPDPRDTGGTPVARPVSDRDAHTEQFAAYRDEGYDEQQQTRDAASWSAPAVPAPLPSAPSTPTGLGRSGGAKDSAVAPALPPSGGKRALREQPASDEQRTTEGQRALREEDTPEGERAQPEVQSGPEGPEQNSGDEPATQPVPDKKVAKRLAKEQRRAAKDAAKAEKAAAEQAAKDQKPAAKAAKRAGRGRGTTAAAAATADAGASAVAAGSQPALTDADAHADVDSRATATPVAGTDGAPAQDAAASEAAGTAPAIAVSAAPSTPRRKAPILVVLLLLFIAVASGAAAWLFQQQAATASRLRPSSNIALLDKAATADAVSQVSKAVEAIYSYDSGSLDQSESQALSQITGSYVSDFKDNFAAVRALPPQQRASLSSKVTAAGVITLTERRASLLVMLDQEGRRGDNAQPVKSAVRLSVTAQRVDGQWKVSDISQK